MVPLTGDRLGPEREQAPIGRTDAGPTSSPARRRMYGRVHEARPGSSPLPGHVLCRVRGGEQHECLQGRFRLTTYVRGRGDEPVHRRRAGELRAKQQGVRIGEGLHRIHQGGALHAVDNQE